MPMGSWEGIRRYSGCSHNGCIQGPHCVSARISGCVPIMVPLWSTLQPSSTPYVRRVRSMVHQHPQEEAQGPCKGPTYTPGMHHVLLGGIKGTPRAVGTSVIPPQGPASTSNHRI